jgi:ferredoxin
MADKNDKVVKNVPGQYYVANSCISCGQCRAVADSCFFEDSDTGLYYVAKQPSSEEEKANCEAAMSSCPVEAIGNDGE